MGQQWALLGQTASYCTIPLSAVSPFSVLLFGLYAWEGLEDHGVGLMGESWLPLQFQRKAVSSLSSLTSFLLSSQERVHACLCMNMW